MPFPGEETAPAAAAAARPPLAPPADPGNGPGMGPGMGPVTGPGLGDRRPGMGLRGAGLAAARDPGISPGPTRPLPLARAPLPFPAVAGKPEPEPKPPADAGLPGGGEGEAVGLLKYLSCITLSRSAAAAIASWRFRKRSRAWEISSSIVDSPPPAAIEQGVKEGSGAKPANRNHILGVEISSNSRVHSAFLPDSSARCGLPLFSSSSFSASSCRLSP